jgi:hypothetical protein
VGILKGITGIPSGDVGILKGITGIPSGAVGILKGITGTADTELPVAYRGRGFGGFNPPPPSVQLTVLGTACVCCVVSLLYSFFFVFCVGPAVTHRMYCSLPRLIVLTPL